MRNDTKKLHRGLKPSHKLNPQKFYAKRGDKHETEEETSSEGDSSDGEVESNDRQSEPESVSE